MDLSPSVGEGVPEMISLSLVNVAIREMDIDGAIAVVYIGFGYRSDVAGS